MGSPSMMGSPSPPLQPEPAAAAAGAAAAAAAASSRARGTSPELGGDWAGDAFGFGETTQSGDAGPPLVNARQPTAPKGSLGMVSNDLDSAFGGAPSSQPTSGGDFDAFGGFGEAAGGTD